MRATAVIAAEDKTNGVFERIARRIGLISSAARQANTMSARFSAVGMAQMEARSKTMARVERGTAARAALIGASARVAGPLVGVGAVAHATKEFAAFDRRLTRVGITADADAESLKGLTGQVYALGQEVALPTDKVTSGLEVLVAQGRSLKDSMSFLPSVARTAAAAGAEVEDIAKTADSVSSNFKLAGTQMQGAFDIMAAGGKAGMFELKDMARYLPSLGPAASAIGFNGAKGLADLVSMLQVMRKGSGTAEEAVSSMNNILAKMESDKTTKNFKALGVDSEAAFKKARKEGRNLVEVFEELADKALKGDRSRLGELIDDMEFKRGLQALMTYRGEWQKLSRTIQSTSAGTVMRDLGRVTNDMQSKIDRMFDAFGHRARQLGGALAENIILPLDAAVSKIEKGENRTFNIATEGLQYASANLIANQELDGQAKGEYGPDHRRLIDARKEFLQRERIEAERAKVEGEIARLAAEKQKVADDLAKSKSGKVIPPTVAKVLDARAADKTAPLDAGLAAATARLVALNAAVAAVDETIMRQAEHAAVMARVPKDLRVPNTGMPPRFAQVTPGASTFTLDSTFGGGAGSPTSVEYGGKPISNTLPPSRPPEWTGKPVTAAELREILPTGAFAPPEWSKDLKATVAEPIDVTGKVEAEITGQANVGVTIKIDGPGTVTGMTTSSSGNIKTSVGTSMSHVNSSSSTP
jgi:TP901 family phage tail tape measure protein